MSIQKPLTIALVQSADARNVRSWSGSTYFSKQAMQRHVGDVIDLSPAPVDPRPYRAVGRLAGMITGRQYAVDLDPSYARRVGRYFSRKLRENSYDLIFAPAGIATIAWLETDIPIVYYSDATWPAVRNYYACYTDLLGRMEKGAAEIERRAMERASLYLFSSDWATGSAIRECGVDPSRAHTVYIGANLMAPPERSQVLPRTLGGTIRLLLVGVSWEIKGGAIALETLESLLALGYDAELTVVGCTAPPGVSHPRMQVIPFLNKGIPAERERFESLWHDATLFLLPTRFEAAGVVFCEAGAYALPSIATRTGGVGSLIVEGRNGFTLPPEATGADYARRIAEIVDDRKGYEELCRNSRIEYETRLNWDSWGRRVAALIEETFPQFRGRTREQYAETSQ